MTIEQIETIIPSSPEDRAIIKRRLIEISDEMTKIEALKDQIKAIKTLIKEEYKIPPKIINRMAKTFHKQQYKEELALDETFQIAYEAITGERDED